TRYYGTISARGGTQGGDGGFAEVSGKEYLAFDGKVDVSAPLGAQGSLLLDPTNIVIQAGAGSGDGLLGDSQVLFAEGGANETVSATALQALTGNITLQAEQNITLNNGVNLALANQTAGERVVFQAGANITLGGVVTTGGASVLMSAGDAGAGAPSATAAVNISSTGGIVSGGGDITLQSSGSGGISLAGNLTAGTGTVRLVTTNGGITQTTGAITGNALGVRSSGNVAFRTETNVAHNDVAVFAAQVTGAGSTLSYTNIQEPGDVNIGTVAADALPGSLFAGAVSGVSTNNADLTVTSRGQMTVLAGANVSAGTGTATLRTLDNTAGIADLTINANVSGAKVVIDSADGIAQDAASSITATQLLAQAAAGSADDNVILTGSNNVGTFAAGKSGSAAGSGGIGVLEFNNGANSLTVGTVDAVSGITAIPTAPAIGRVTLTAGSLDITQAISTGSGAGIVTLQPNTGTNVSLGGAAAFDLTQTELDLVTTGTLRIGGTAGAGSLSVGSAITNGPNWSTLILRAGSGGISQTQPLTVTNLGVAT
ncbi:MAG: hypothetical protein Q8L65_17990, partial [Burkholderiales bacterium]|nr:hypothetical protein [Burkholderiales bacterium]